VALLVIGATFVFEKGLAATHQDPPEDKDAVLIPPSPAELNKTYTKLLELHNRERAKKDLEPLEADKRLFAAARRHAEDMAKHERYEHEGSDGSTMIDRALAAGYKFRFLGENIAFGMTTPEVAVREWMNSPGHMKNILSDQYTQVGFAVAKSQPKSKKKGREQPFWCAVFGRHILQPPPAPPDRSEKDKSTGPR
jgi:uncharacterized protein YkwD